MKRRKYLPLVYIITKPIIALNHNDNVQDLIDRHFPSENSIEINTSNYELLQNYVTQSFPCLENSFHYEMSCQNRSIPLNEVRLLILHSLFNFWMFYISNLETLQIKLTNGMGE